MILIPSAIVGISNTAEAPAMSLRFHWFLPTNGDGRDIVGGGHGVATGAAGAIRPAVASTYLGQIARSAEQLGFEAALTPTGAWCEDAWLTTRHAHRGHRAAEVPRRVPPRPDHARRWPRRWPSTFQRQSARPPAAQRGHRRRVRRAARLRRLPRQGRSATSGTGEFLDIVTPPVARRDRHPRRRRTCSVEGARLSRLPDPVPDLYFGGSSARPRDRSPPGTPTST